MNRRIFDLHEAPPLGEVPEKMHAWVIRQERFGEPNRAFRQELVDVPKLGNKDVLVRVMAAGINYNNVWVALGEPLDVIAQRSKRGDPDLFHIGGSDASGIVHRVGSDVVDLEVGDEVVVHCGRWDDNCEHIKRGGDPTFSPTFHIWGYEGNYGSFAQFTRVQSHQCVPKPRHLTWEAAASYMLVGATAFRMLLGWGVNRVSSDDMVLIWGASGGLGSIATQLARIAGATVIGVVSSDAKGEHCVRLGAKGYIDRTRFDHWGLPPHWSEGEAQGEWTHGARRFGRAIWEIAGERRNPTLVFEHVGESTIPTSIFVCATGGMVVICGGTTGYSAHVDLRYLWMRQKRLQGSHFANDDNVRQFNQLVIEKKINPCLSRTFEYRDLPVPHQMMYENVHPLGNMAVLVGSPEFGLGAH